MLPAVRAAATGITIAMVVTAATGGIAIAKQFSYENDYSRLASGETAFSLMLIC